MQTIKNKKQDVLQISEVLQTCCMTHTKQTQILSANHKICTVDARRVYFGAEHIEDELLTYL